MVYTPSGRLPTNRELLAAKQGQAPVEPKTPNPNVPAAPTPNVPAMRDTKQAVQEYNASYRSRYLDEIAPASIAGRLIKFNKDGSFIHTDDETEVPEGSEFIVLADETQAGFIKFNGPGEAPTKVMGLIYDGFEVPARETLGDLDPKQTSRRTFGSIS